MENLEKCLKKMAKYPNLFYLTRQINKNIKNYFDVRFDLKILPADFLMFISFLDGIKTDKFNIFSIYKENKPFDVLTFEENSTEDAVLDYLDELNIYLGSELFFFAGDESGGRYAFKKNIHDNQIYYIPNEKPAKIISYDNFTTLLENKVDFAINNYIRKNKFLRN